MKKILAYLILSIFTLINLQQVVLMGSYLLSQDYITQKFCINKDKPALKCNGKCHLKDAITKANTNQEEQSSHLAVEILFSIFYIDFNQPILKERTVVKHQAAIHKKLVSNFVQFCFHPPQTLSFT